MVFGEERHFNIVYPYCPPGVMEFFLRFKGKDHNGFKMKGTFPKVWTIETEKVYGPLLFDEDIAYEVVKIDYDKCFIWIKQFFDSLENMI